MANDSDDPDDFVGYKKPPLHTRFKKGQSGNPKGRPKGTKNFKTDLMEELGEQVLITEAGKDRQITKQRAIVKRTMQKAMAGDMRAIGMFASWVAQFLGISPETVEAEHLSPDDEAIINRYISKAQKSGNNDDSDKGDT